MNEIREKIFESIKSERHQQDLKWGADRELDNRDWLTILVEEVGEAAEKILKGNILGLYGEVIQIVSVGVAWLECQDRNIEANEKLINDR